MIPLTVVVHEVCLWARKMVPHYAFVYFHAFVGVIVV